MRHSWSTNSCGPSARRARRGPTVWSDCAPSRWWRRHRRHWPPGCLHRSPTGEPARHTTGSRYRKTNVPLRRSRVPGSGAHASDGWATRNALCEVTELGGVARQMNRITELYIEQCTRDVQLRRTVHQAVFPEVFTETVADKLLSRPLFAPRERLLRFADDLATIFGLMISLPNRLFGGDLYRYCDAVGI